MVLGHYTSSVDLSIMDHSYFDIKLVQFRPEASLEAKRYR